MTEHLGIIQTGFSFYDEIYEDIEKFVEEYEQEHPDKPFEDNFGDYVLEYASNVGPKRIDKMIGAESIENMKLTEKEKESVFSYIGGTYINMIASQVIINILQQRGSESLVTITDEDVESKPTSDYAEKKSNKQVIN